LYVAKLPSLGCSYLQRSFMRHALLSIVPYIHFEPRTQAITCCSHKRACKHKRARKHLCALLPVRSRARTHTCAFARMLKHAHVVYRLYVRNVVTLRRTHTHNHTHTRTTTRPHMHAHASTNARTSHTRPHMCANDSHARKSTCIFILCDSTFYCRWV
jgi:hypothetical protein